MFCVAVSTLFAAHRCVLGGWWFPRELLDMAVSALVILCC